MSAAAQPSPVAPQEIKAEQPPAARAPAQEIAKEPEPVMQQQACACPNCKSSIAVDQQFCGICGTKLVAAQPGPAVAPPAPTGAAPAPVTYETVAAVPAEVGA